MGTYERFEGKFATFDELAVSEDQSLHNSNMLNLVSATRNIDNEIKQMELRKAELEAARAEIKEYAENGDLQNTSEVSRLFGLVSSEGKYNKRNKTNW